MAQNAPAKSSSYQPDKRTIGELLSMTNPPIVVPNWQRSYSWTQSHIETFWNDLTEFTKRNPPDKIQREYFLGSVVIVATSANEHLLLDGQQRLATAAILLSVVRDFVLKYNADAAKRIESRYLADIDDARNELVYKLTLNAYDKDYFRRKILEFRNAGYQEPKAELPSHSHIESARKYFEDVFVEAYAKINKPDECYRWALLIQNVLLNHMSLVAVTSSDEDSAAEVFETLNDRGIGLSTPDLLRNLVIRRAPEKLRDDIVGLWGEVIQFEDDAAVRAFLRHYWISRHGDVKTQRLYREIKGFIIDKDVQSLDFSRDVRDASITYREIIAARDSDPEVEECLRAVDELAASILYPIMLTIMEKIEAKDRLPLLEAVLNLYVRHSVIGQLENSKLENVIYNVASGLRNDMKINDALEKLADFAPPDEAFESAFQRISVSRTATQRYLLRQLEIAERTTTELDVNPPHKVHVEHIYPQTPQEGQKLAGHPQLINRIGNLTLLAKTLNIAIRNGTFDKKLPAYAQSEILITRGLEKWENWNAGTIDERQKRFGEQAPSIWPIVRPE